MSNYQWGQKSLLILEDKRLHPTIKDFMDDVLSESKYDMAVIDGARDKQDQKKQFDNGASELDGENELSDHQIEKYLDNLGRAIDFIPAVKSLGLNIWDVDKAEVQEVWAECFRAFLRVDRLWKQKGIDVGLELGWTYDIKGGRDYPHVGFKKIGI